MRRTAPLLLALLVACGGSGRGTLAAPGADLSGFATERIAVDGAPLEVWLAETTAQQQQGLMHATPAQLAPLGDGTPRGMLFVFATDRILSFFMRDTFVPLDLAYAAADGTILEIHALAPLDETPVSSLVPARYALEAPAGTFAALGIGPGSVIDRP